MASDMVASTSASSCSPFTETFEVHFPPNDTFTLTSTMLHHDTPNMFSTVFLNSSRFVETAQRRITIRDKSPDLFTFILDYLRGYTIFPLAESSIPARWLPLQKTYENLRRDAAYYGLIHLERECTKWLKQVIHKDARQAVFNLDFAPFSSNFQLPTGRPLHPLSAEMILDCHVADICLLRKRFLKPGAKTLTYGPIPWKQIFDRIRGATEKDGIIQMDGSSLVEVGSVFLKPPQSDDVVVDDRKVEFARIHISKEITQLILDGVRPGGMNSYITVRFHATEVTTRIAFQATPKGTFAGFPPRTDLPVAHAQLIFNDKLQRDGYLTLLQIPQLGVLFHDIRDGTEIRLARESKTVLEVDGNQIEWNSLCSWSKFFEDTNTMFASSKLPEIAMCERLFGSGKVGQDQKKSASIVRSPPALTNIRHRYMDQLCLSWRLRLLITNSSRSLSVFVE